MLTWRSLFYLNQRCTTVKNIRSDFKEQIEQSSCIRGKLLTKLMFESKLICMYFQSNSIPLAPTHRGRHLKDQNKTQTVRVTVYMCAVMKFLLLHAYLDITSSAVAQPIAATMILYSPLPALRDITRCRPSRSARSTVAFMNSWKNRQKHHNLQCEPALFYKS